MSRHLSPESAAKLANLAYVAYRSDDMAEFKKNAASRVPATFSPLGGLITGRTGFTKVTNSAIVFNRETGGGNEKVVSIRGTQGGLLSQDWLTNGNIAVVPGPSTFPCHAGFFFAYRSLREAVHHTVGARPQTVHVVGHSLGGAQATLMALDLKQRGHDTYLYTFGAPRVGPQGFTADLTRKFPIGKLYRVFDPGDPVPMIPLFPFLHAPLTGHAYKSGANRTSISTDYHSMDDQYVPSAEKAASWAGMRKLFDSNNLEFGPSDWLRKAGDTTRIPGMGMGLWALGKALEAILQVIARSIQFGFAAALTVPDMLAWALMHAVEIGGQIRDWVLDWIRSALRWLGREVIQPGANITRVFLRYVLEMFLRMLANVARRALQRMERGPQA